MANRDIEVDNLIINELTRAEFDSATKSETELYFVTDDKIQISEIEGLSDTINSKQDIISDIDTIRTDASSAKLSVDTHTANTTIHVTAGDKVAWSNKQAKIDDLEAIRDGASKGATALQSIPDTYALKTDIPTNNNQLDNGAGYITASYHDNTKQNKLVAGANIVIDEDTNTISASGGLSEVSWGGITGDIANQTDLQNALADKQAKIDDLDDIRNGASKGATALQSIPSEYITETELQAYHDSTKQNVINDLETIRDGASKGATALQSIPSEYIKDTDLDNVTISKNISDKLQAIAIIDNKNNAIKTWTGTQAEYDVITVKDANTLYNVTDTDDVSHPILEMLYPIGAIYMGTMAVCPLQALFGSWQLKSIGVVTGIEDVAPVAGNGMTLGLTDGTNNCGLRNINNYTSTLKNSYDKNVGSSVSGTTDTVANASIGVTTDPTKSGLEATVVKTSLTVNIWERVA